jgi:hypothetical protein
MAQATHAYTTSKFHNLSNEALADAIGNADAVLKGAEAECEALKDEFKARGVLAAAGERFVTRNAGNHPRGKLRRKATVALTDSAQPHPTCKKACGFNKYLAGQYSAQRHGHASSSNR